MWATSRIFLSSKGEYYRQAIEPLLVVKTGNLAKLNRLFCPGLTDLASPENPGAAGEKHNEIVAISE
ncbi:hypothetical protein [Klebsiella pneumoniae]|uniref:hypothetical protein n=1 Tax=Klebsiella pneumoniae TaxID=573 RepID=UPI002231D240|nr:hypothetical protein [Klebsiella pneumoniae]MDM8794135.1 hypothetical protein [Klebsiella pneumoniae]